MYIYIYIYHSGNSLMTRPFPFRMYVHLRFVCMYICSNVRVARGRKTVNKLQILFFSLHRRVDE